MNNTINNAIKSGKLSNLQTNDILKKNVTAIMACGFILSQTTNFDLNAMKKKDNLLTKHKHTQMILANQQVRNIREVVSKLKPDQQDFLMECCKRAYKIQLPLCNHNMLEIKFIDQNDFSNTLHIDSRNIDQLKVLNLIKQHKILWNFVQNLKN